MVFFHLLVQTPLLAGYDALLRGGPRRPRRVDGVFRAYCRGPDKAIVCSLGQYRWHSDAEVGVCALGCIVLSGCYLYCCPRRTSRRCCLRGGNSSLSGPTRMRGVDADLV